MADTGFKIPTTDADLSGASQQFQNRVNARTDDANTSSVGADTSSNGSHWGTLAMGVPGDATSIDGIEIVVRARDLFDNSGARVDVSPSIDAGANIGTTTRVPTSSDLTTTATEYTIGGPTSLLGLTPTVAQINAADFYIRLVAFSSDGFHTDVGIELIKAKVYYTPSGGGATGTANVTLAALTSTASGQVGISGEAAPTLAALTSTAAGEVGIDGDADVTLEALTSEAEGTVIAVAIGSASITLVAFSTTAAGEVGIIGTANITLAAFTSSGYSPGGGSASSEILQDIFQDILKPVLRAII